MRKLWTLLFLGTILAFGVWFYFGVKAETNRLVGDGHPWKYWFLPDAAEVISDGNTVSIIALDQCGNVLSGEFDCFIYSTTDGDEQQVTLSNGKTEWWTTKQAEGDAVYFVRADGSPVVFPRAND